MDEIEAATAVGRKDLRRINRVAAPVREQVVQILRTSIVSGALAAGQRIIEREICEATGASRTSVREALRQLESERLITILPQRGPVVSVIDAHEAASLCETRAALEELLARTCAGRASQSELAAIAEAAEALERTPQSGDRQAVEAAAGALYDRMLEGAHNPVAEEMLRLLHVRLLTLQPSRPEPGVLEQTAAEMAAIARAIVARDADGAAAAAKFHVMNAGARAIGRLRADDSPSALDS